MSASELGHLTAIASLPGVGPARLRLLLESGPPGQVWARLRAGTIADDPLVSHRLGAKAAGLGEQWRKASAAIEPEELERRQRDLGIRYLDPGDPEYPAAFRDDIEPPVVLWALGDPACLRSDAVAIVGTRHCTRYGHDVARRFGRELADAGVSVVSGLALGVDAAAHAGTLGAPGTAAPPIAVVGSGLDVVYPTANRSLWRSVAARGVIFSEAPPGAPAEPWRFPARNRLIAALSRAVVVVESPERGGSLYTVDEAIARGVGVHAVPGPVTSPASAGTNRLLADGAAPALCPSELLESLGVAPPEPGSDASPGTLDRQEVAVLGALAAGPATLDELAERAELGFDELVVVTARMEAQGALSRSGGWYERRG